MYDLTLNENQSSVSFYARGTAVFDVFFPGGKTDCRHCHYCRYAEAFSLYKCGLTNDYIEKNELNQRHVNCPIRFEETQF